MPFIFAQIFNKCCNAYAYVYIYACEFVWAYILCMSCKITFNILHINIHIYIMKVYFYMALLMCTLTFDVVLFVVRNFKTIIWKIFICEDTLRNLILAYEFWTVVWKFKKKKLANPLVSTRKIHKKENWGRDISGVAISYYATCFT